MAGADAVPALSCAHITTTTTAAAAAHSGARAAARATRVAARGAAARAAARAARGATRRTACRGAATAGCRRAAATGGCRTAATRRRGAATASRRRAGVPSARCAAAARARGRARASGCSSATRRVAATRGEADSRRCTCDYKNVKELTDFHGRQSLHGLRSNAFTFESGKHQNRMNRVAERVRRTCIDKGKDRHPTSKSSWVREIFASHCQVLSIPSDAAKPTARGSRRHARLPPPCAISATHAKK